MKSTNIKEMLRTRQLFTPCIQDCMTARAAELSGFPAMFMSGGAISYSQNGLPDMAFNNAEEMISIVERITNCTDLPLLVDADDGYGDSPVVVYHNICRLIKAGAAGFTIDDTTGFRGWERMIHAKENKLPVGHPCVSREAWLSKIKAAVEACKGTGGIVIARTEAGCTLGLDESITRCVLARELGAQMTVICGGMESLEDARKVSKYVNGWKMWPDVYSVNGLPTVTLDQLNELGFNLVTFHIFEKAALYGMMLYGTENKKNGNTVFSDTHDMNGNVSRSELEEALTFRKDRWLALEKRLSKTIN